MSFHGHAEGTRNGSWNGTTGGMGREVVAQRGLEEPKQARGQGGADVHAHTSTSVCTLCMGQHAGPRTQGPRSASSQMPTGGLDGSGKTGWATCS